MCACEQLNTHMEDRHQTHDALHRWHLVKRMTSPRGEQVILGRHHRCLRSSAKTGMVE
jgi:hypothetical protein